MIQAPVDRHGHAQRKLARGRQHNEIRAACWKLDPVRSDFQPLDMQTKLRHGPTWRRIAGVSSPIARATTRRPVDALWSEPHIPNAAAVPRQIVEGMEAIKMIDGEVSYLVGRRKAHIHSDTPASVRLRMNSRASRL